MSYDPQSPTDAADFADDDTPYSHCDECGEEMFDGNVNVEAFEATGKVLCPDCADAALSPPESEREGK